MPTNLWERFAILLLTLLLSFVGMLYNTQQDRIKDLESKSIVLQTTKVDRGDLKEFKEEINASIGAMKSDLIARATSDKNDVLARIDLYMRRVK